MANRNVSNHRIKSNEEIHNILVTKPNVFTLQEKQSFLNSIRQDGFNIIFDLPKLKLVLPGRSDLEIKHLIQMYKKKAHQRELERKKSEDKLPIEKWQNLVDLNLPSFFKKEEYSRVLTVLLERFKDEHVAKSDSKAEIADAYNFLHLLSQGIYPAPLSVSSNLIILSILDGLCDIIQKIDFSDNNQLISQLYKKHSRLEQKIYLSNDIEKHDIDEFLDYFKNINKEHLIEFLKKAKHDLQSGHSSSLSMDQNPLNYYSMLPRMKRIKKCFNPLEIPVEILVKQHEELLKNQSSKE